VSKNQQSPGESVLAARLNRDKLRLLAETRLTEARVLLESKMWTGSYYMTGLAVECALKAYLAQAVQQHDFPDRNFVTKVYSHNLKELARMDAAFWLELETEIETNVKLRSNLNTVLLWDNEIRYGIVDELQATSLYTATTEAGTGVMDWIRRRWK
jgi:HEPN domain-containing protein